MAELTTAEPTRRAASRPTQAGVSFPGAAKYPAPLPFRAVNRANRPEFDPGLQRHHLLPRQLLGVRCFGPLFETIGRERLGFDDFRRNGLLLPARDAGAVKMGLPLHRGPHRAYNALVIERVGQIEAGWAVLRGRAPEIAICEAAERLELLQRALRRRLLNPARRLRLNAHDPLGSGFDFAELDQMVEALWPATASACGEGGSTRGAETRGRAAKARQAELAT